MQRHTKPTNKFGLLVEPEPDASVRGDQPHHAKITMQPKAIIPAHFHLSDFGEVYRWIHGGSLALYLQPPEGGEWIQLWLNNSNAFIGLPPLWRHGGMVFSKIPVEFEVFSRADHFRENTHQLPDHEQPEHLRYFIRIAKRAG